MTLSCKQLILILLACISTVAEVRGQWIRDASTRALSRGNAVAANNSGQVYTAGILTCVTSIGGVDLANNSCGEVSSPPPAKTQIDAYLSKHDEDGNLLWVNQYVGEPGNRLFINDLVLDDAGNCYIAGAFSDTLDLKVMPKPFNKDSTTDAFVARILPDGTTDWVTVIPVDSISEISAQKLAVTGNRLYMTGYFRGRYQLAAQTDSVGNQATIIAGFDLAGTPLWAKNYQNIGGLSASRGKAVEAFGDSVWVACAYGDSLRIENDTIPPISGLTGGAVLALYNSAGTLLNYDVTSAYIEDIRIHPADSSLYFTGVAANITVIGNDTLFTGAGDRAFVSSHYFDNSLKWAIPLNASNPIGLTGLGIDTNTDGSVIACGIFNGPDLTAPSSALTGSGGQDGFVIKLDAAGVVDWLQHIGGNGDDAAAGVSSVDDDRIFAAGYFTQYIRVAGVEVFNSSNTNNGFTARIDTCPELVADMVSADTTFVCLRDSALLQVTNNPGNTYQWFLDGSPLSGATLPDLYAKDAGTYYAEVSGLGCVKPSPHANLYLYPLPDSAVITNDLLENCEGDSVTLTGPIGNYTFKWLDAGSIIPAETMRGITVGADGDYQLEVSDSLGCSIISDTFMIRFYPYPLDVLTPSGRQVICSGDSLAIQADTSQFNFTYQWRKEELDLPDDTLAVFKAFESGTYDAVIHNAIGCETLSKKDTVVVQQSPLVDLNDESLPAGICEGDTIRLVTPAVSGQGYQWSKDGVDIPGATIHLLDVSTPGEYQVRVNNANCERLSDQFDLSVNSLPNAAIANNVDASICANDNYYLNAAINPSHSYQWIKNSSPVSGADSTSLLITETGNYSLLVTNPANCAAESSGTSIIVNLPPPAFITPLDSTTFCDGGEVTLRANAGNNLAYEWRIDGMSLAGPDTLDLIASDAGTYTVTVTNVNNCEATSNGIEVKIVPIPVASLVAANGVNTICERDSLLLTEVSNQGYMHNWIYNTYPIPAATGESYYATAPGDYSVVASVGSCRDTSNVLALIVRPNPIPRIRRNDAFLSIALFDEIQWYVNGIEIPGASQQVIQADLNGLYTVSIVNGGCTAWSDPVSICLPVPELTRKNDVLTVSIEAASYAWFYGGIPIAGASKRSLTVQQSGLHFARVTDVNGCTMDTDTVTVCIPYPIITRDPVTGVLYAAPNPARSYQWYYEGEALPGATTQVHIPESLGSFKVEVRDLEGCISFSEPFLIVPVTGLPEQPQSTVRFYPNPVEQELTIEGLQPAGETDVMVFDGIGRLVHAGTADRGTYIIDFKDFHRGLYRIVLHTGTSNRIWTIVKQD